jgi:nicotinate-nucleotide pyrophosphorylase (carboxylating)
MARSTLRKEFEQIVWDDRLRADWEGLLRLAVAEDLGAAGDWTTQALVPEDALGRAAVVAREPGVIAGLPGVEATLRQIDPRLRWLPAREDGDLVQAGDGLGQIEGPAQGILAAERLLLNLLGRLSGIATLTRRYVEAVQGTKAKIYDTRKTTPGWRRLEKYAVGRGGGRNHRTGLFDAVLIKDNHLALWRQLSGEPTLLGHTAAGAVTRARQMLLERTPQGGRGEIIVEVEVDTLEQFEEVLSAGPDIVLLDNMDPAELRQAVARRNACNPQIELEASGKVDLRTVREIAETGVERISIGALTHSAESLDIGLDWIGADVAKS